MLKYYDQDCTKRFWFFGHKWLCCVWYKFINMPGSANSICNQPIKNSTNNLRNVLKRHLLTIKAVLHFKWVSYYLPSKKWNVQEQLALTTFHLHFLSHLVLWPTRNYYTCSTPPFHLLINHISRGLQTLTNCIRVYMTYYKL